MHAFAQLSQRQTFPSTAEGRRALIRWLRKHKVGKAAMEASGGYERDWAKALREAGLEVLVVDPKRVRSFAKSAGRLAKNDPIDAEMIAWFAETFVEATEPGSTTPHVRSWCRSSMRVKACSTCRPVCKTGASIPHWKSCRRCRSDC